jgi:hypothetical protein
LLSIIITLALPSNLFAASAGVQSTGASKSYVDGKVSDTAYNATSWDNVTTIAPSKNAVRDRLEALAPSGVTDVPHGGTGVATLTDHGILLGSGTGAVTPMAVLDTGAMLVGVTGADPTSVSPNITTTKKFLTETGTGAIGATPVFDTIISGDLTTALATAPKILAAESINTAYATVASHATTSAIWAATGNIVNFTGTETITDFPAAPQAGAQRTLICAGAAVFTHGGSITVLGGATYTASANDKVQVIALSTTTFFVVPMGGRVKFPGGENQDGIVFGNLGTATKGLDLSGSGLSGWDDHWIHLSSDNFWSAEGTLNLNKLYNSATLQIATGGGEIRLALSSADAALVIGNAAAVGSLTSCTSNGTTTITKALHGLTLAAGELVHITGATTAADKGFYRYMSGDANTIVVDRALAGSDGDVALTVYKDVIGVFATDGTNGQRIMNYSAQNKPLQLGGDVLAATTGLAADDVIVGGSLGINDQKITAGAGTGVTVVNSSLVNRQIYKVTTAYTAYSDSDTTKGIVIATLPAKMKVVGFYADTTAAYSGGTVSAATLEVGITAEGAAEIIATHDVKTAAVTKGLADADMGTGMTRAAQIQGGYLPSWAGTTAIYATIDTTDGNTNALTAGSTTFYIETEQF